MERKIVAGTTVIFDIRKKRLDKFLLKVRKVVVGVFYNAQNNKTKYLNFIKILCAKLGDDAVTFYKIVRDYQKYRANNKKEANLYPEYLSEDEKKSL